MKRMKKLHTKTTEIIILLPVIVFLVISGYYLYSSYTHYEHIKKSLSHIEYVQKNSSHTAVLSVKEKQLSYAEKESLIRQMKNEQRIMIISVLALLLSLLYGLIIRNIFVKISRDDESLKNIFRHIKIDPEMEKKYNIKEVLSNEDTVEIYQLLEMIFRESEESKHFAEKANETKSLFLANMSHEIRTPLNGIVGFTDLLKSSGLNSEQNEFVHIIEKSSENLLSVINDILDLSKIESEKIEIEEIEFDPIVEFESGIESYGAKAAEKNIDLGFYMDPALSKPLIGDPNKIKQVLVNLISNAVKFTPERGRIDILIQKVQTYKDQVTVMFSVKDTGIGISDEQKGKIFEAFSQADSSTSRKFGGTGLGLTISKKLVKLMGGQLDLASKEGRGANFFFSLILREVSCETKEEKFDNIRIGYYLPDEEKTTPSDKYVQKYITALHRKYNIFNSIESLLAMREEDQPDLLFVNFEYIGEKGLSRLHDLRSKISLLTTVNKKNEIKALNLDLFKIIYAPVNFSKIKRALLDCNKENIHRNIKESEQNKLFNIKALVAEDNPINQKLIKLTLENFGISVTLANNGKEAFELRRTQKFDMIFMDIQMPVMGGIEATQAILDYEKENGIGHIPIVAVTANALKGDKERFLDKGMDQYISKPIKLDEIDKILNQYFPHKSIVSGNTASYSQKKSRKEFVDILLCKKEYADMLIFDTLLTEAGYSVDVAENITEVKKMIQSKQYGHVLLDRNFNGLSQDNEISQQMKRLSIKSILFVEDRHSVREEDYANYSRVVLNIPNITFLKHVIEMNNQENI